MTSLGPPPLLEAATPASGGGELNRVALLRQALKRTRISTFRQIPNPNPTLPQPYPHSAPTLPPLYPNTTPTMPPLYPHSTPTLLSLSCASRCVWAEVVAPLPSSSLESHWGSGDPLSRRAFDDSLRHESALAFRVSESPWGASELRRRTTRNLAQPQARPIPVASPLPPCLPNRQLPRLSAHPTRRRHHPTGCRHLAPAQWSLPDWCA